MKKIIDNVIYKTLLEYLEKEKISIADTDIKYADKLKIYINILKILSSNLTRYAEQSIDNYYIQSILRDAVTCYSIMMELSVHVDCLPDIKYFGKDKVIKDIYIELSAAIPGSDIYGHIDLMIELIKSVIDYMDNNLKNGANSDGVIPNIAYYLKRLFMVYLLLLYKLYFIQCNMYHGKIPTIFLNIIFQEIKDYIPSCKIDK